MLATDMCTKAVRRGKLIGVVCGDEFTIALSDVPWIHKKVHLVPGPTLKKVIVFFVGYLCISQLMCVYA